MMVHTDACDVLGIVSHLAPHGRDKVVEKKAFDKYVSLEPDSVQQDLVLRDGGRIVRYVGVGAPAAMPASSSFSSTAATAAASRRSTTGRSAATSTG